MTDKIDINKMFDVFVDRPDQQKEDAAQQKGDNVASLDERRKELKAKGKTKTAPTPLTPEQHDEINNALAEMDKKFWLMRKQSKTRIMSWRPGGNRFKRAIPSYMTKADFELLHANKIVNLNGKPTLLTQLWLTNWDRVTYDGDIYAPDQPAIVDNRVNLWTGWGCEPRPGEWGLMRRHIYEVLANGDKELGDYMVKWIAWMFQHPGEPAEVAIVLRGKQGTGKGTLCNALMDIVGRQNSCHLTSTADVSGNFNSHLANCTFVFADEATWGGDKQGEGRLNALITEPTLSIERKGFDKEQVDNAVHMISASNSEWVVPANEQARRYVVSDVAESYLQDESWFGPIKKELNNGGKEAMFHELKNMELGHWHPRQIIKTQALQDQKMRGLSPEDEWWCGLLHCGHLPAVTAKYANRSISGEYTDDIGRKQKGLFEFARASSPRLRLTSDHAIGRFLTSRGCVPKNYNGRRSWQFPSLCDAREAWEKRFGPMTWDNPEEHWHPSSETATDDNDTPVSETALGAREERAEYARVVKHNQEAASRLVASMDQTPRFQGPAGED